MLRRAVMKGEGRAGQQKGRKRRGDGLKGWSRLQMRMTFSYVGVSVVTALLIELLIILIFLVVIARLPIVDQSTVDAANNTAEVYALEAAVQAGGGALDPHST